MYSNSLTFDGEIVVSVRPYIVKLIMNKTIFNLTYTNSTAFRFIASLTSM